MKCWIVHYLFERVRAEERRATAAPAGSAASRLLLLRVSFELARVSASDGSSFCRFEEARVNRVSSALSVVAGRSVVVRLRAPGVFLLVVSAFGFADALDFADAVAAAPASRPATVFGIGQHFGRPSSQICEGTHSE